MHISIYNFSIFSNPNFKKIPNHASTHYVSDAYPIKTAAPKTAAKKSANRPMNAHKIINKPEFVITVANAIKSGAQNINPKTPRNTFRKNINKAALAKYFDNDVVPSRAEIAQDKLDTWLMQTMFELENADIAKAERDSAARQELIAFVESIHAPKPTTNITPDMSELDWAIEDAYDYDYDADYDPFAEELLMEPMYEARYEPEYVGINSIDMTEDDKFERLFFKEQKFNEDVRSRFLKKYRCADTSAAMRAFEKQKRHSTKLAHLMHELQITK